MVERKIAPAGSGVQRWTRIVIVLIGATTLIGFIGLSPILRTYTKRDRADAPVQHGIGIVEQIVPPRVEENAKPLPAGVWVRINGTLASADTVFGSAQLAVGRPAEVTYRVGRSGRIYVDRVEPLPEDHPGRTHK